MNQNSMCYWLPRIKHLQIPMPETLLCSLSEYSITQAAESIGYPFFLRTDLCSGKHDWKDSCFVPNKESIASHMQKVLEANVRWQMLGIEPQAFAVRKFLDLETSFTAFSGGMPINKERRYFVSNGRIVCSHPYWPVNAFNNHPARMADGPDWEEKLRVLNQRDASEFVIDLYAEEVACTLGGEWSIDFAKDKTGTWWLLDMALAANSYHFPH